MLINLNVEMRDYIFWKCSRFQKDFGLWFSKDHGFDREELHFVIEGKMLYNMSDIGSDRPAIAAAPQVHIGGKSGVNRQSVVLCNGAIEEMSLGVTVRGRRSAIWVSSRQQQYV